MLTYSLSVEEPTEMLVLDDLEEGVWQEVQHHQLLFSPFVNMMKACSIGVDGQRCNVKALWLERSYKLNVECQKKYEMKCPESYMMSMKLGIGPRGTGSLTLIVVAYIQIIRASASGIGYNVWP